MKDLKLVIVYALFAVFMVGVCVWGLIQDYKYGGNPEVGEIEHSVDTIVVYKNEGFTLEDRLDSLKSVEMFNIIQDHYNPQHDYHWALKLWNSGAPLSYHRKVMDKFNEIKNEAL